MSAAVGITVSTTGYVRPEDALQDAAIALHRAKAEAATPCELFDPAMRERAVSRLRMETDLRHAIDRQEFEVHYQPIVALATGRITGFEALVRWRHPERGLVSPVEFIPVAEDTGMIRQIGRIILTESCRQMVDWQSRFGRRSAVDHVRQRVEPAARAASIWPTRSKRCCARRGWSPPG